MSSEFTISTNLFDMYASVYEGLSFVPSVMELVYCDCLMLKDSILKLNE